MDTMTADPFELTVKTDERLASIKNALRAMSHHEQQVLLDHDRGGKSLTWIAARLGISHTEARAALDSARARLRGIPDL